MIKYLFLILVSFSVFAENRQKIVVIDTGVSFRHSIKSYMCKNGVYSTYGDWRDQHGHGSNVIGLIAEKIDSEKTCIVSIKLEMPKNKDPEVYILKAMEITEKMKPVAVNISMSGGVRFISELYSMMRLLAAGTKIVVAAGNDSMDLDKKGCPVYPACYLDDMKKRNKVINTKNFIVVGTTDTNSSNTGSVVTVKEKGKDQGYPKMTGTSQATANFTGKLFSK
jgi:hypothetical protein